MRLALIAFVAVLPFSLAVKEHDFKKCDQSGFCRRGRALADRASNAGAAWKSPYSITQASIIFSESKSSLTTPVTSSLYPQIQFELQIDVLDDGVARVRLDEKNGLRQRYNEAAKWALVAEPSLKAAGKVTWASSGTHTTGKWDDVELEITHSPLRVALKRGKREEIVLNDRGLLHLEHYRVKDAIEPPSASETTPAEDQSEGNQQVLSDDKSHVNKNAWFEGDNEDAFWEETFSSWTDSKPKGPESLSLDIDFPNHGHVYGIPQHAAPLSLPETRGTSPTYSDPYRHYNADVFEYLASSPMSIYGSIPLMHAQSVDSTVGVFNALGSETWIDVYHPKTDKSTSTHWIAESGILDVFLLPGPTPDVIFEQYARLTGTTALPAHWALGHHQCRWNYVSSDDVRSVSKRFDEEDIPLDVIWLDIEYSEEHKYFIWEKRNFPDPVPMTDDVALVGRKMVAIIDPHLKRVSEYPVYDEAQKKDLLVKTKNGDEYEGWCWSGSSAWLDFFNPAATGWWKHLFQLQDERGYNGWRWKDQTNALFVWNDMNEPAIFNGPEITMPKDMVHYGGWEHRDVHNINGVLFHKATALALENRTEGVHARPFVLSRSFYAGSQRWGAIWSGDNMGTWEHMAVGIRIMLSDGIAGMTFSGADVGGFFGNPEHDMLVRWYQVGLFMPFFRAHAHIDTKRREPYLLPEPYKSMLRDALRLRYTLLPVFYTAFRAASATGVPVLRPQYAVFPKDAKGFAIDDQFYIGSSGLLGKPITAKDQNEVEFYLSDDQPYYDYFNYDIFRGASAKVKAGLEKVPILIQGGSIVPTRQRPRRSSPLMKRDPFTLTIALDKSGRGARGELYLDDGETYAHKRGELVWREFSVNGSPKKISIVSRDLVAPNVAAGRPIVDATVFTDASYDAEHNAFAETISDVGVERIVVLGIEKAPSAVHGAEGAALPFHFVAGTNALKGKSGRASVLTIKNPNLFVVKDWDITINL